MSNTNDRNRKEIENLLKDPKYARKAWKAIGNIIATTPARRPIEPIYDKEGNIVLPSLIEQYSYNSLKQDLDSLGEFRREPTELEMILQCQMVKARYDTAAATFVRDTLGAKPVDETKLDAQLSNPYESLSDEELEMIQEMRERKALEAAQNTPVPTLSIPEVEE